MPTNGENTSGGFEDRPASLATASKFNMANLRQNSNNSSSLAPRQTSNDNSKYTVEGDDPISFAAGGGGIDKSIGSFKPFSFGEGPNMFRNSNERPDTKKLDVKESIREVSEGEDEAESQEKREGKVIMNAFEKERAHKDKFDSLFPDS